MGMKKRLAALLCALALAAGMLAVSSLAATDETIYLLALNDKVTDLRPLLISGNIYVPYTTFDRDATGVDLGVYYGRRENAATLTLTFYSKNGNGVLVCQMYAACVDGQGNPLDFRAVYRGDGIPYLPMAEVCAFFGLRYSVWPTQDRGTLVRITNGAATMTDDVFFELAQQRMLERYTSITQPGATPTSSPTRKPVPTSTPLTSEEKEAVYLAVDMTGSESDDWMEFAGSVPLLALFDPKEMAGQSDQVRKAVAGGFTIGFQVEGTLEEAEAQLKQGNDLLSHIARLHTRIVSAPPELARELAREGWCCWQSNVSGTTATSLLNHLENMRVPARLTLPAGASVEQVLRRLLQNENYILTRPLETDLG